MGLFVNNLFLSNEIIILLFSQILIYFLLFISFFISIKILKNWDYKKSNSIQYSLEKKSYLVILIISFALFTKIFISYYFIYSIDSLTFLVPGAMCAAGIFSSNDYGEMALVLKIINLFFIGFWLILNSLDLKQKDYKYTKLKFSLFILVFILLSFELLLDFYFLINIPTKDPVNCCSIIFGISSISSNIPFNLNIYTLILIFYLLYFLVTILSIQKKSFLLLISNILFVYIAYFSVTYFFSTYIYELPTHQCPFCMLQIEYNFIGYIIWSSLFLGLFFSICTYIFSKFKAVDINKFYKLSLIFNLVFVSLVSFYVVRYYILNGVLL